MAMTQQKALSKVFGDPQKKILKRLEKRVAVINGLSEKYEKLSDEELQAQTAALKKRLTKKNVTLDTILPDAFAVVREAAKRVIGERRCIMIALSTYKQENYMNIFERSFALKLLIIFFIVPPFVDIVIRI